MSIYIIQTFVSLRDFALSNEKLANKVTQLENKISEHDDVLITLIREVKQLVDNTKSKNNKPKMGFI
jgi:hypothetical protein